MKSVSILISACSNPHHLKWHLESLARQTIPFAIEILVLNDGLNDETEAWCRRYKAKLNIKYIFTGQRNLRGSMIYRAPGLALNVGIQSAEGQVIVISCAEMFHINNTLMHLVPPVKQDSKTIATCLGMDDDGTFIYGLEGQQGFFSWTSYHTLYPRLNTRLPFLMAVDRQELLDIGGFDEDFKGLGFEGQDLVSRLIQKGCCLYLTQAQAIRLYHPNNHLDMQDNPAYQHNQQIHQERRGLIIRNQNRKWGQLNG